MGWMIVTLIVALAVGAFALPEVRAVLVEFRDRLCDVDIGRVATGLASNTRELCSDLYQRVRFGGWSFRGRGGRDFVPLNEVVFDPHDSGDPTELLLGRGG